MGSPLYKTMARLVYGLALTLTFQPAYSGNQEPSQVYIIAADVPETDWLKNTLGDHVYLLNENEPAVEQITNILADHQNLDAIHLLSHGEPAQLNLGTSQLGLDDLPTYKDQVALWGDALNVEGELILYGCNIAQGRTGQFFIRRLAEIAGHNVGASTDLTGDAAQGGNWDIEYSVDPLKFPIQLQNYPHILQTSPPNGLYTFINATDNGDGTYATTDGFFVISASDGQQVRADQWGAYVDNNGLVTGTSYIEVRVAGGGSYQLTDGVVADYNASSAATDNDFTNVHVIGYLDGDQVAITNYHNSIGIYETNYNLDFSGFSGKTLDAIRVYYSWSEGTTQWAFNLESISISGASNNSVPTVTTTSVSTFDATSATLGGDATADGGALVTERGIVYATTSNPTTASSKVQIGTGTGIFSQSVTGLSASTTYYVRAYAINAVGTSYGNEVSFTTSGAGVLLSTSPTISFSNNTGFGDNIAEDGEGGSIAISDINIQALPINSSGDKLIADPVEYHDGIDWPGYPAIITYGDLNPHFGWSIRSDNGADFSLVSVDFLDWGVWEGDIFVAEAFHNSTSKGTVTFTGNIDGNYVQLSNSGILTSIFSNVDEVRIYLSGGTNSWIALNNIQVTSPVSNELPTVTTSIQSDLSTTSATLGGNVTSDGNATVTERGIVYAITSSPTTSNTKVQIGSGTGIFSQSVTGLSASTTYYVRAYAINAVGTSYGNEISFTTAAPDTEDPQITCVVDATKDMDEGACTYTVQGTEFDPTATDNIAVSALNYSLAKPGPNPTLITENFNTNAWDTDHFEIGSQDGSAATGAYKSDGGSRGTLRTIADFIPSVENPVTVTATVTFSFWESIAFIGTRSTGTQPGGYGSEPSNSLYLRIHNFNEGQTDIGHIGNFAQPGNAFYYNPVKVQIVDNGATMSVTMTNLVTEEVISFSGNSSYSSGSWKVVFSGGSSASWDDISISLGDHYIPQEYATGSNSLAGIEITEGETFVTWTAEDAAGNEATCTQTITVTDTEIPSVIAADDVTATTPQGTSSKSIAIPDAVFGDNCSGSALGWAMTGATISTGTGQIGTHTFNRGTTTITYTATDAAGNTASDVMTISLKEAQAITFAELADKTVDAADFNLNGTASSGLSITYVSSDTAVATISGNTVTIVGLGSTTITASQAGNESFLAASDVERVFTTTKIQQTITFPSITDKTYGDAPFSLGNEVTDQELGITYTAQDPSVVNITGNQATILKAGTTKITASQAGDATHAAATSVEQNLTINQKALTATAEDKSKIYGDADPEFTVAYAGFITGDDSSDLSGTLVLNRVAGEHVDTYNITPSGLSATNYSITFAAGELEITQKALTVAADSKNKIYGEVDPAFTVTYVGFITGDDSSNLSGTLALNRVAGEDVDTYTITPSGLSSTNYSITFAAGELEITQKALTVTADDKNKIYGQADPEFTVAYAGFVTGDDSSNLSGTLAVNRVIGEDVNTYAITPSGLSSTNYSITFAAGELEITQKVLTVTTDNKSKIYGEADPEFTVAYAGFITGDDSAGLSGTLALNRVAGENVDTYDITPSGLSSTNYSITFVAGELEITQKALTVSAENKSKLYGEVDPEFTVAYAGFITGDDSSDLSGTLAVNRVAGEDVNTYDITPSGLSSTNYSITLVAGELEITQKPLSITDPQITLFKIHDGNNEAMVIAGTLVGIEGNDDVYVDVLAVYENALSGTNKTITVSYTLNGVEAYNYTAPLNFISTEGEIEENEPPVIATSSELSLNEGQLGVATLSATDANNTPLTFSLSGGTDKNLFSLETTTGELSFLMAPDFEEPTDANEDNQYEIEITVTDGVHQVSKAFTITILDVNDNIPVVDVGQSFDLDDQSVNGYVVGTLQAGDEDATETIFQQWMIQDGNEDGVFALNSETGALSIADNSKLNRYLNSEYRLQVTVSDGIHTSAPAEILIRIMDSGDPEVVLSTLVGEVTNLSNVLVTVQFSEPVTGFDLSDVEATNGQLIDLQEITPDKYTFSINPVRDGTVQMIVSPGSISDASGNTNTASNQLSFYYDGTSPIPVLSSTVSEYSNLQDVSLLIEFSEMVQGLEATDIEVENGSVISLVGSFSAFTLVVQPAGDGVVMVNLPANKTTDQAGNGNEAASFSWIADFSVPEAYQIVVLTDAVSALNMENISFEITNGEAGASYSYSIASSGGRGEVTGSGTMASADEILSGIDLSGLPDGTITITVTLTDEVGNQGESVTSTITKDTKVSIPQGFSPNGDGIDDQWIIPGIEEHPDNMVTIYNRYGRKVWTIDGYDNEGRAWDSRANVDGLFGSANLPDGTYFYIIEFVKSDMKPRTGYVIVKK